MRLAGGSERNVERIARSTLPRVGDRGEPAASEGGRGLSQTQLDAVSGFIGYGNPAGSFWFVGIEERGVRDHATLWAELLARANHFAPIEDLKAALEHPACCSPTSPITGTLEGLQSWAAHLAGLWLSKPFSVHMRWVTCESTRSR
jgi:hypothetical protein